MRALKLIVAALLVATYVALALRFQAWLTVPADPELAYRQALQSYSPTTKALSFIACFLVYLTAGGLVTGEGVMALLTVGILASPIVGMVAGFCWSCLVYAFGGGFDPVPAYYGITGGLIVAAALLMLIITSYADAVDTSLADADDVPRQTTTNSWLKDILLRVTVVKLGGTVAGNGITVETTLRDPTPRTGDQL